MRTALTFGLCLIALTTAVAAPKNKPANKSTQQVQTVSPREAYRAQLNDSLITIMAGAPSGTDLAIAHDIAEVLDDEDAFRIVPMVGKGGAQSIKDVLYLRGVDMGITHANLLKYYASNNELGPLIDQVVYVAKLFNEEVHILVRDNVADISALKGKPVNLGEAGSDSDITGHLLLQTLGIEVDERHYGDMDAIAKLKSGDVAGVMMIGGKPLPVAKGLMDLRGLKLRVPSGVWRVRMFKDWGASPTVLPYAQVYSALQSGTMEGQENPFPQIWAGKFHEVQKYLSLTGHVYSPVFPMVGENWWQSLPADVRATLERIALETQDFAWHEGERMDRELLPKLGATLKVNEVDKNAFIQASRAVYEEFAKEVPGGGELIKLFQALM